MLSILIPIYNYDCSRLIKDLYHQCRALRQELGQEEFDYELVLADDASTNKKTERANREAAQKVGCRYITLTENVSRAKIRNILAREAKGDYLLFLDCDTGVANADFVRQYWADRNLAKVVCGNLRNPIGQAPRGCELRYRYECQAEVSRPTSVRRQTPYACFTTFSTLFHREVFDRVEFDERCTEYGYEDALMGLMLDKQGIPVAHTDNALFHNGIDSNASFLQKTETALRVLHRLGEPMQSAAGASRLTRRLDKVHLTPIVARLFQFVRGRMRHNLLGHRPSLLIFKLYKLGYYVAFAIESRRNARILAV